MMKSIIIPQDSQERYFPGVFFDVETGKCEIIGESFMESPDQFYNPLLDWLHNYFSEVQKPISFNIKLRYLNTASTKFILEMLKALKSYTKNNGAVEVKWFFHPEDEDMEEEIKELSYESDLEIIPVPEKK